MFVGFNNKHYDDYIFKGILSGLNKKIDFIRKENGKDLNLSDKTFKK